MQMTILQTPAASAPQQAGNLGSKSSEGESFGIALGQSLMMSATGSDNALQQTPGSSVQQAAASALGVPIAALSSLFSTSDSATTDDVMAAINSLLEQLNALDKEQLNSESSLTDLQELNQQLDQLLVFLGMLPVEHLMLQSPVISTEEQSGQALPAEQLLQRVNSLTSSLEGALSDLRTFLQQQGGPATLEQAAVIGKQLEPVKQLLDRLHGRDTAEGEEVVIPRIATHQSTGSHLQRMSNQLLHAGLLTLVPAGKEAATAQTTAVDVEEVPAAPVGSIAQPIVAGSTSQAAPTVKAEAPPVPVEQFAKTMESLIVKQFRVTNVNGQTEARLSLTPEHLGQVHVKISMHNGQLMAMFVADSAAAKELLENQMVQLRSALQSQGLQVEKLEVAQSSVHSNFFQDRGNQHGREQGGSRQNKAKGESAGDNVSFDTDLAQTTLEQAVNQTLGYGRGISARA